MPVQINNKEYYSLHEISQQTGVSKSTLLRWMKRGIIPEPLRDRRGWRIFSENDKDRIRTESEKTYRY